MNSINYLNLVDQEWNWDYFLDYAIEGNVISKVMHSRATNKSSSWTTCAVGKSCDVLPKLSDGSPFDEVSTILGYRFHNQIKSQLYLEAKETIKHIEARTVFLLKQPNYIDLT
jgi:hypothetical protein